MAEYLIEYRYQTGETLKYQQTTYYVLEDPEIGRLVGSTVYLLTQKVLRAQDGLFDIDFTQELISKGGPLGDAVPDQLVNLHGQFRMDKSGGLHGNNQLPSTPAAFPSVPIAAGIPWTVRDTGQTSSLVPRTETVYQVERFEVLDGRLCAQIVSQSALTQQDESGQPAQVQVQGHVQFDLEAGRQVRSNSVVQTVWEGGKSMQTAIELEMVS